MLESIPARDNGRNGQRAAGWARITDRTPELAATFTTYLDQMSVRLRPNSIAAIDSSLRPFAGYLIDHHEVRRVADVRRDHLQGYKAWLAVRPGNRGPRLANQTIRGRLGVLVAFFSRLDELDIVDRPARSPIVRSDLPIKDDPLPRSIDDAAFTKLLAAARAHPDPFIRTSVELLARTGMRRGELLGLTIDGIVQIDSSFWLRVPLGKLHTDRYVPLHPQLKDLLDRWIEHRGDGVRSKLLFIEKDRRIAPSRLSAGLSALASDAGIGHVHPHQPSVFAALDQTFRRLGGVPTYVLTDNEKTVTTEHIAGIPVRNPQLVGFAEHYSVVVHTCVPADPASKGGNEASVKISKADLVPKDTNQRQVGSEGGDARGVRHVRRARGGMCGVLSEGQHPRPSGHQAAAGRDARRGTDPVAPGGDDAAHGRVRYHPGGAGQHADGDVRGRVDEVTASVVAGQ